MNWLNRMQMFTTHTQYTHAFTDTYSWTWAISLWISTAFKSINRNAYEGAPTFGMFVAECLRPHVTQSDRSLAAAVDEQVAFRRMELGRRYDFCQLLHVGGFDVDNVWLKSLSRKPFLNVWQTSCQLAYLSIYCLSASDTLFAIPSVCPWILP